MRAMLFDTPGAPLRLAEVPIPDPAPHQVRVRVSACGVCRTDLHLVDGDLEHPKRPVIPGHQIVGRIEAMGADVRGLSLGERIGIPWLGATCGRCRFCQSGCENLCDAPTFTGYQVDGGFAELAVADARFCFPLPEDMGSDVEVAPLLCAGLIGYRSYHMATSAEPVHAPAMQRPPAMRLGIYGVGAAAHIIMQVARFEGRRLFAFTRPGDAPSQALARELGAEWVGGSDELPPEPLDAAIIYAPVGPLVPAALRAVDKGGVVVCAGIHMSDIPSFAYELLWGERSVRSVANLTRADGHAFLALAPKVPVRTRVTPFELERANEALTALRRGVIEGAAVLDLS